MQWHTQVGSFTTNLKVKIYSSLPELSATKNFMRNFHVYDSDQGRFDVILGRDILTDLESNLKYSYHVIESYDGPFIG